MKLIRLLFLSIILISLPSCDKPTYSKDKVEQSVIKLCKDEYGLNVKTKIIGSTLGVFIPIDGLIDPDLKLNKDAGEKIENVALSIHRVITSTDRPLKFYVLNARDTKTPSAEFILTGFVYDVVRVRLLDISRGEYHQRILRDFKYNPILMGQEKIKEFFDALNQDSPSMQAIKPLFYPIYTTGQPNTQKIDIEEMDAKEISAQEVLFYIKTREYYELLPGFEVYRAIFPSGFSNEYLILIDTMMFPNPIKEIVPKYFYSGTEIRQRNLQESFGQYKDSGYIGIDGLPKKDLGLNWFLSQQIARRIPMLFEEDKYLKQNFIVQFSQGSVENRIFRFTFSIAPTEASEKDYEIMLSKVLKLIGTALHLYPFEDFEGVELSDIQAGRKTIYVSRDKLEDFRKNRLKIEDILN